jgi:hypothetical protein
MKNQVSVILVVVALGLATWVTYAYNTDFSALNSSYSSLQSSLAEINSDNQHLRFELNQSYAMQSRLLSNYSRTQIIYRGPASNLSVAIWTIPQPVKANGLIAWELLDTFDNHITLTTNVTARVVIVDLADYVNLAKNLSYAAIYNSTGTTFQYDMRLTQGCAAYVLVVTNVSGGPMLINPNVTATYAPTPFLTGACSLP